jgi:hypothetical protein
MGVFNHSSQQEHFKTGFAVCMLFLCNIFSRTIVDSAAFWKLGCFEVSLGCNNHAFNKYIAGPLPFPLSGFNFASRLYASPYINSCIII